MNTHQMLCTAATLTKACAFVSPDAEQLSVWTRTRPGYHAIDISYVLRGCKRRLVVSADAWNAAVE